MSFSRDFSTFTEVDKYMNMYLPEIVAFKPILEAWKWTYNEAQLWVQSSEPGDTFKLIIEEKPENYDIEQQSRIQCLNKGLVNNVFVAEKEGVKTYMFNSIPYSLNDYIGVSIGLYTIFNIPESDPIGFVINDISTFEILSGTEVGIQIIEDNFIMHYSGTLRFRVKKDFGTISYHSYNNGYLGGEKRLIFTNECN